MIKHLYRKYDTQDLNCILQKEVTHSKERDYLVDKIKNQDGEENMILVLMYLKN